MNTRKILIVDDETRIVEILDKFLSKEGFNVEKAYDGDEALEIVKKDSSIDLIVLDEKMPYMNGTVMCEEMEKLNIKIPVILLTGSLSMLKDKDFKRISYENVAIKPIRLSDLKKLIDRILGE